MNQGKMGRKQHQQYLLPFGLHNRVLNTFNWRRLWRKITGNRLNLIIFLIIIGLAPPFFFHFRLTHFQEMQMKNCGWLASPPLVCAHGGDSINAFPNTVAAYRSALHARVDCIEIDVSRSADGFLFALHDRDLQRISGNHTATVGLWSKKAINELGVALHFPGVSDNHKVPTVEDALTLVSNKVRVVILDAKVGPPFYEKGLAEDILAAVGYIIMKDPLTGSRSNVLRMKRAKVVGVYHPLIDEKLVEILHGRSKKIFAWTVDDMVSMRDMLSKKVDAVVTSNPALFQQLMDDTRVQCLEEGFSVPR
ncbi:hypothetical protein KSS87_003409 [Heliosperma pusillum]|nr:hypothetical protein KSS87_003409 [Heliosperma pusillum]